MNAHWDEVEAIEREVDDIAAHWQDLGRAAGSIDVGLRKVKIAPGRRNTPWHAHGAEEEIFFLLAGDGLLLDGDTCCEVAAGDTIVHLANGEPHTLRAGDGGLEALAFGTRARLAITHLPRAGKAWGTRTTCLAALGQEDLFESEAASDLDFGEPDERISRVVNKDDVEPDRREQKGYEATRLDLGRAAGSQLSGLRHVSLDAGALSAPPHCHSAEEELFVVLSGAGHCLLGDEELPVKAGSVISRPAGSGVAHAFRAGQWGMELLCYGTRVPDDVCYYPRSGKLFFRGLGVIGRFTPTDYWDGEL